MFTWNKLDFWKSGEWDVISERLQDLDKNQIPYCPQRKDMFAAFKAVKFEEIKVAIIGQDPYPNPEMATGIAFSVPSSVTPNNFPPTLRNIYQELVEDLRVDFPRSGDLKGWTDQGVLMWNAIPSCEAWKPASHRWPEWELLTEEIVERLSQRYVVIVFLGALAGGFHKYCNLNFAEVITCSHPSPRGAIKAKNPFKGSRLFSTINLKLKDQGLDTINWRL